DESARTEPSQEKLNQHLDEALESLQEGYRRFPGDVLTQYYLAIALTMKNQRIYAQALNDYNKQFRNMPASDPAELKAILEQHPWPLLDQAISLLSHLLRSRIDNLSDPTRFNLAHVYATRDANGDLNTALDLLFPILGQPQGLALPSKWKQIGETMLLK